MKTPDPLVLTVRCGGVGWTHCEELRMRHFPPERNVVPAHLILFHHLPGAELATVTKQSREICDSLPAFSMRVSRVRSLGRGVALVVESPELLQFHRALSTMWGPWLIPQDRVRFSPHVTIQNKVTTEEARHLFTSLSATFTVFPIDALGVDCWWYRNGPWEHAQFVPFGGLPSVGPTP